MIPVRLITSQSHDPFKNLMIEYHLLNQASVDGGITLFLYRNDPCVVIGRFQCPWREINFLKKPQEVTFVRRHSGGGTVYHDLGNWNFCFIREGTLLSEVENILFLQNILNQCDVPVLYNDRHDLLIDHHGLKKISGSAFRRTKNACFHHGTLLVDAKLTDLKGTLGCHEELTVTGSGVSSHPSPVINIKELYPHFSWDQFCSVLEKVCQCSFEKAESFSFSEDDLNYEKKLRSWQWLWGSGPQVRVAYEKTSFDVHEGIIKNVVSSENDLKKLEGLEIKKGLSDLAEYPVLRKTFLETR